MLNKIKIFLLNIFGFKIKKNTVIIQNKMTFIIMILLIPVLLVILLTSLKPKTKYVVRKDENICMSTKDKLNEAFESYKYYTEKITEEELAVKWLKMFSQYTYKMGGDPKFNQLDCIGSVWFFLKSLGYQGPMVDVNGFYEQLERQSKKINNFLSVRHTHIIVFQPINGIPHIGIIYKKSTNYGYVQYMEMTGVTGNFDFNRIRIDDPRIKGIYQISFDQWKGSIL
jgi:hypothetical protein